LELSEEYNRWDELGGTEFDPLTSTTIRFSGASLPHHESWLRWVNLGI